MEDIKDANFRLQREFLVTNFRELDQEYCPEDEITDEAVKMTDKAGEKTKVNEKTKTDKKTITSDETTDEQA
jgi:hypothetical protein